MTKWPIYYKDVLTVANPNSNVGVCTLWTPKDVILRDLDPQTFSLGGQLYSKRGINFILRNVLANPIIDTIILCGADRSESGEALMKFMHDGIDKECVVKGDDKCEIQKEIDKKSVEAFRKNVKLVDMRGVNDPEDIQKEVSKNLKVKSKKWAEPKQFQETVFKGGGKFPSEKSTFSVRADHIWEAWVQQLRLIMKFGSVKGMIKIGEIRELVNLVTVVEEEDPYEPEISEDFNFSKNDLELYYKDFFNPDKGSESYNYGERLYRYPVGLPIGSFNSIDNQKLSKDLRAEILELRSMGLDQLEEMYEKFSRYHEDRGLVAALWNPWVDNVKEGWMADKTQKLKVKNKKIKIKQKSDNRKLEAKNGELAAGNVPCMIFLQFTYRSKKLHLTAYFRSNDIFDAWPRNAFALRKLQFDFAKRIGKKPGYLTTISNLAQIYQPNYEEAQGIIKKYSSHTFCMPDRRSAVIIELDGKEIVARVMGPDGNIQLEEFRVDGTQFKATLKLLDILRINNVFGEMSHAMDVTNEIAKAEWCVKNGKNFIQDRDWGELVS